MLFNFVWFWQKWTNIWLLQIEWTITGNRIEFLPDWIITFGCIIIITFWTAIPPSISKTQPTTPVPIQSTHITPSAWSSTLLKRKVEEHWGQSELCFSWTSFVCIFSFSCLINILPWKYDQHFYLIFSLLFMHTILWLISDYLVSVQFNRIKSSWSTCNFP